MRLKQPLNLIGERVRQARYSTQPKLTQTNLASKLQLEELDIDQSQVSKIENGTRPVSDFEVALIARVLNVSSSWLLNETDNPQRMEDLHFCL
jgi:HTH-type transcriptional regulator, cell division transcriptional repressor